MGIAASGGMEGQTEFPGLGDRLLVVFDGRCGLCNRSIRWFLKRDLLDRLRFVPSESPEAARLLARHGLRAPDSIVVVRHAGRANERLLTRSAGVVEMLLELPRPWSDLGMALSAFPRPVRDFGYRVVARARYRVFGRYESCPLPTAEERRHFL